MKSKKRHSARERRSVRRAIDYGVGRKKLSEVSLDETVEEAFDWLERGGVRRIWQALKIVLIVTAAIFLLILFKLLS